MKKLFSIIAVLALLLGLSTAAAATDTTDQTTWDTSVFEIPDEFYFSAEAPIKDLYSRCYCTDVDYLGVNHYDKDGVAYYKWQGNKETMPANVEENNCCFTNPMTEADTVVFWDGVPNLSKDLFKYWEGTTKDIYIPDSVTEIDEDAFVMNSTITLHFSANNAVALAYAEARGMNYEIVPEPEEVSEPDTSEPHASEPASGTVTMDTSIFFEHPEEPAECMDEMLMGLCHEYKHDINDIVFFGWSGRFEKMPPCEADSCFGAMVQLPATVVFLDGVPNLVNDLFKEWEVVTDDVYIPDSVTEIDEDCFVKGSHITLHFTKNNAVALTYAQSRGMAFEVMDGERLPGDVNFDKSVDMKDTLSLRKSIANLPAAYEIYSLDINADGSVDMKDVLKVRLRIWYDSLSPSEQILASFFGWF